MLISITEVPVAAQPWRKKKLHKLACDLLGCGNTWEAPYRGNRAEDKLDFCCPEHKYAARRRGEKLDKKLRELSLQRWGVTSPNCRVEVKHKAAQTKEERWGDKNYNNRPGAEKTCRERMGCSNPFQSDLVKKKIKDALSESWGVTSPIRSPLIRAKIESTLLLRVGVTHTWRHPELRERLRSKEVRAKIHRTMKERGRYGKSQVEDRMYGDLCELYGPESVERQVILNGWCIDFRVRENTYIQLDGVYWHGLNRPAEALEASQSPRDRVILRTVRRDAAQNEWCRDKGIRLVRITDAEYKQQGIEAIIDRVEE